MLRDSQGLSTGEGTDLLTPLGAGPCGFCGTIAKVGGDPGGTAAFAQELERLLLEIGFVEGARVEIVHEGFIGGDPIVVRVDDMKVALRRREANAILVRARGPAGSGDK